MTNFSIRVPSREEIRELEVCVPVVLGSAELACRELADALAREDLHAVIAAERRLLAAGLMARESALRLGGGR